MTYNTRTELNRVKEQIKCSDEAIQTEAKRVDELFEKERQFVGETFAEQRDEIVRVNLELRQMRDEERSRRAAALKRFKSE